MNPYQLLVSEYARLLKCGKANPFGNFPPAPRPELPANAPKALIFSPHPDDECIIGALALRLLRESRVNVINVAVTQGSKKERQAERLRELEGACYYLGYGLQSIGANGLEKVTAKTREQDHALWRQSVKTIAGILISHQPRIIFFPHEHDWNGTHIGTHFLLLDALKSLPPNFECYAVETEYWGQMDTPNLMVESGVNDVADLVTAASFHVGEMRRNPFHLLLPAWMQDNVRRGAELVGGQGEAAPDFTFATLDRLRRWRQGKLEKIYDGGRQLSSAQNPAELFA